MTQLKLQFQNHYNQCDHICCTEENYEPSQTIPDQALSIPEIIRRYASGLPLGAGKEEIYNGEDDPFDGVDISKLDLAERAELIENAQAELQYLKDQLTKKPIEKPIKPIEKIIKKEENPPSEKQKLKPKEPESIEGEE